MKSRPLALLVVLSLAFLACKSPVTPPTYSVVYQGNGSTGGTAPVDAQKYQGGATVTVLENSGSLVKTGEYFSGWNTKADGTGTFYAPAATFTMGTSDVTLYAVWSPQNYTINGNIQKGPFSSGSSITIQALDRNLDPTGDTFQTVTIDDFGAFKLGSRITMRYVEIIAKGYYFNEISGSLSPSELTLRALTDLASGTVSNVNLLTTLEAKRVAYLIRNNRLAFADAKAQAESELLAAFKLKHVSNVALFETMDISKSGESNAILLAISCILQRANTVAQLSELISKISLDIETDGTIDTASTKAALANYTSDFTAATVTSNLTARYAYLGLSNVAVPDFSPYLDDDSDGLINKFDFTLGFAPVTNAAESTSFTSNTVAIVFPPDITTGTATTTAGSLVVNGTDRGTSCQVSNGDTLAVKLSSTALVNSDGLDRSATATVTYGAYSVSGTYKVTITGISFSQVTAAAPWVKRHSAGAVVFNNKMWIVGGYGAPGGSYAGNDVWSSADGVTWTQTSSNSPWSGRYGLQVVSFNQELWIIGGDYNQGNTWHSSDGITWKLGASNQFLARQYHSCFVFDNKIWIMGGWNSNSLQYNDVWYSSDGISWTQATANAGWLPRCSAGAFTFAGKMWVVGGYANINNSTVYLNDVWSSTDGVTWTQTISAAAWKAGYQGSSFVYNNRIFVTASSSVYSQNDELWASSDGISWIKVSGPTSNLPSLISSVCLVFNNKVWFMSGYSLNPMNDGGNHAVWSSQ